MRADFGLVMDGFVVFGVAADFSSGGLWRWKEIGGELFKGLWKVEV